MEIPSRQRSEGKGEELERKMKVSQELKELLLRNRVIAVVGFSRHRDKDSHRVPLYLLAQGYEVIPVNPHAREIVGIRCYPSLLDIPTRVEIVNIFRPSKEVYPFVEQAVKIGAKVVWMQEGIANKEAADLAEKHGLRVIMNTCIYKVHTAIKGRQ